MRSLQLLSRCDFSFPIWQCLLGVGFTSRWCRPPRHPLQSPSPFRLWGITAGRSGAEGIWNNGGNVGYVNPGILSAEGELYTNVSRAVSILTRTQKQSGEFCQLSTG